MIVMSVELMAGKMSVEKVEQLRVAVRRLDPDPVT